MVGKYLANLNLNKIIHAYKLIMLFYVLEKLCVIVLDYVFVAAKSICR